MLTIHALINFSSAIIHSAMQPDSRYNNLLHFIWDFEWCLGKSQASFVIPVVVHPVTATYLTQWLHCALSLYA